MPRLLLLRVYAERIAAGVCVSFAWYRTSISSINVCINSQPLPLFPVTLLGWYDITKYFVPGIWYDMVFIVLLEIIL